MLVILFPVFWALFTSVYDYTLIAPNFDTFIGFDNYRRGASAGRVPAHALWLTFLFVVAVVVLEFLIGFAVALMLNAVERFKAVYYAILLCPLLINPVVVGLIWRMFLHPELGIVNYLLSLGRLRAGQLARRAPRSRSGPSSWSISGIRSRS